MMKMIATLQKKIANGVIVSLLKRTNMNPKLNKYLQLKFKINKFKMNKVNKI